LAPERRDARIGAIGRRAIEVPEPEHQRARQEVTRRIIVVGRAVKRAIGDWAYQELACTMWATAIARQLAGDGSDVAAGAPARNHHRPRPPAQFSRVLGDPARRRVTVLCRCWEAVFGRMPVTDADEDHPGTPAHITAVRIVGVLVAQHP